MTHTIFVPGRPVPKGSARSFVSLKTGKGHTVQDNVANLRNWQGMISQRAFDSGIKPTRGSVTIFCDFIMARPKSHFGKHGITPKARLLEHLVKPDLDKLTRAVLDALTGIAYHNDAQANDQKCHKRYAAEGEIDGVRIVIIQN